MGKAVTEARSLRRRLGLQGLVDIKAVAAQAGLYVNYLPLGSNQSVKVGYIVGVSSNLLWDDQRWVIAHALGHHLLHPRRRCNARPSPALPFEREADEFAYALLVDEEYARCLQLDSEIKLAWRLQVPVTMVRKHAVNYGLLNASLAAQPEA